MREPRCVNAALRPLHGRLFRDGDDVLLIVGNDTTWLLRAKPDDLPRAAPAP